MASVASPYGVQVLSSQDGLAPRAWRIPFGIANGLAANIYKGQPVKMNPVTGTITPVTNAGGVPDQLLAIFDGVDYTPLGSRPIPSPFWAAGSNYNAAELMHVFLYPLWLPGTRLKVQADGSVAQALLGSGFNFTTANLAGGNTFTGTSSATVIAAGVPAGSQAQLAFTEFATDVTSTPGDAFTDMIFTVAYPQIGFRGQNSIG